MTDFALYNKECYGRDTIECESGFIVYEKHDKCIYIHILYVKNEFRGSGEYFNLCHQAMDTLDDCDNAVCYVDMTQRFCDKALSAFLKAGCSIDRELTNNSKDRIYLLYTRDK